MKPGIIISWILAVFGMLAVTVPPFFITNAVYDGNSLVQSIGRLHVLVLHFPIAMLMLVPVMEIAGLIKRWRHLREAVPQVLILCSVFSVITCNLGLLLAAGEAMEGSLLQSHMLAGILTTVLVICLATIRSIHLAEANSKALAAYILLLVLGIGALVFGSHQGASMVHGKDYLFEHLPAKYQLLVGYHPEEKATVSYDSIAYESLIVPILRDNCYSCHDNSVTKGGFRMDAIPHLASGGKSGRPAVVAGDSGASELFRRITLDRNDEKAMPPLEKEPLTTDEIALLQWWINTGASPDMTLEELSFVQFPDEIEKIVTGMLQDVQAMEPLDPATLELVFKESKESFGIDVIPYTQDLADGVYVVTRNAAKEIGPSALAQLKAIGGHIRSISLWNRNLQANTLSVISEFTNVRELHLNQSNVASGDLSQLAKLKRLHVLNLHGTAVDDSAIPVLSQMRHLRKLFIADTRIDQEGVRSLQEALPNCEILWMDPETGQTEIKQPIRLEFAQFKAVPNWGLQDIETHDHGMGPTHGGIAIDREGIIYVSSHTGIHLFNPEGKHINAFTGTEYADIHAMFMIEEKGVEYIYAARNRNAEILKLTTEGEIVQKIAYPPEAGDEGKFMPTAVTRTADGSIIVTDGYGSNRVFRFDADGNFIETFGGKDMKDIEKFNTPHGISLDTRYDPVRLLISDREKRRLVHFDLQGNFIAEVATGLRRPCAVSILGEYIAVAELEGRVVILNGDNEIIHELGENPNAGQLAKFKVPPDEWQDGIHTAPHGLAWDTDGNLYVQDWNSHGRITKWERITEGSGY